MKKITKVILHNFKSHTHSEIPFENFTAIIGPTNSGKSAIVKGIKLCLYNEPSGDRFITHGEKLCYSEVQFDDGTSIRRTRGKDDDDKEINSYDLADADGEVTSLSNFGVGPVEPVIAFHGMPKVNIFGEPESLNICDQLSAPFFLAETPGKRAKMIGKLAKTDIADNAVQNINLEVRRSKQLKKEYTSDLKQKQEELEKLKDLPHAEIALDALNAKLQSTKHMTEKLKRIVAIKKEMESLEIKKQNLFEIIKGEHEINELIARLDNLVSVNNRMTRIMSIQNGLLKTIEDKEDVQRIIDTIDMEKLEAITKNMDQLISMIGNISNIQRLHEKLKKEISGRETSEKILNGIEGVDELLESLDKCKGKLFSLNQASGIQFKITEEQKRLKKGDDVIHTLEQQYDNKFQEYKTALVDNKQCPVCQSEITEEKVADIKDLI